ncbi:MAG: CrcB family protein [Candidatus Methanoperedens sp.]
MEKIRFVYILIGGFFGSALRESLSLLIPGVFGILFVNITGCFVLGCLMYATELGFFSEKDRYLTGIGFCGGLTTFSTFIVQTMQLPGSTALLNVTANIVFCLVGVSLGRIFAKGL